MARIAEQRTGNPSDKAGRRRVVILGSTGSIGRQALDVVRRLPDQFEVVGLAAGSNVELLRRQVAEFRPRCVSTVAPAGLSANGTWLPLAELAALPEADLVLVATVGIAGLAPTLAAIRAGKTVALANKEVLVVAGEVVTAEARSRKVPLLPVDSEHSAIWQCIRGEAALGEWDATSSIARLILTASGGAFRDYSTEQLARVEPAEALCHPTWVMGPKVTVDAATLLNKGFEIIEAHWLFGLPYERIDVLLHRESVVHSLVEFVDGSSKAQLSQPDMRLPIQYALSYPARFPSPVPPPSLSSLGCLTFRPVDEERYPCLKLARHAALLGGTYPAALSGADEAAVALFLSGAIGFLDIARLLEAVLAEHEPTAHPNLEELVQANDYASVRCRELAGRAQAGLDRGDR